MRGDGIGEIAGGRAADGREMESARGGESRCDNAVLEGEGRKANGVVLEIEIFQAPLRGEFARGDQRRAANGAWTYEVFRKREKRGITPHIEVAAGKIFAANSFLQGIVIIGDFERGETVFAERAGNVAPGSAAFAASEFVVDRHCDSPSVLQAFNKPSSMTSIQDVELD